MDYSKLSDFEINKLVAEKLGYRVKEDFQWEKDQCWVKVDKEKEHSKIFDYCGDANDAHPIILDNKISVIYNKYDEIYTACCNYRHSWGCESGDMVELDNDTGNENPLRAAMITFLKMNE